MRPSFGSSKRTCDVPGRKASPSLSLRRWQAHLLDHKSDRRRLARLGGGQAGYAYRPTVICARLPSVSGALAGSRVRGQTPSRGRLGLCVYWRCLSGFSRLVGAVAQHSDRNYPVPGNGRRLCRYIRPGTDAAARPKLADCVAVPRDRRAAHWRASLRR
jgi:hypothetical protein